MTLEEKKERLSQYIHLKSEVIILEQQWQDALELKTWLKQEGAGFNEIQEASKDLDKIAKNISVSASAFSIEGIRICEAIERVKDARLRRILTERYIAGNSWETIAKNLNIELRWLFRLHNKALEMVEF